MSRAQTFGAALELLAFSCLDDRELVSGDAGDPYDVVVHHAHAVLTDRSHRKLGLRRHAELANEDHIETSVQRDRNLERDGHAAARQTERDEILRR